MRRPSVLREALLALLAGLMLAVVTRRPQDLATTVPGDARDPVLLSWVLAWPAHALTSADTLWNGNIFAPLENSAAFTDILLGYLPFGVVGEGPGAALVRYNLVLLFASALAFAGMYVLVRQLGLGRAAALVAATAFAFNPWRVSQLNHLQVLSSGGIPLALAMLARGHGVRLRNGDAPPRPLWALAGWITATWQISLGFGIGLQLAYVLAACSAAAAAVTCIRRWRTKQWPARRLLAADAAGILVLSAAGMLLAQPYFEVVEDHPNARRPLTEVSFYSPEPSAFITAPGDSWLWGGYTEHRRIGVAALNEKALFPGLVVTTLAAVGLLPGLWSWRRRAVLAAAVVVLCALALGTSGPAGGRWTYLLLYEHAPGWQGIRTPSRLVTTAWLALALLAAHGVVVLRSVTQPVLSARDVRADRTSGAAVAVGLAALALLEGLDTAPATSVRPTPAVQLAALPQPVLVLPSEDSFDQNVMLWSTDGYPRVVNGVSGFTPQQQMELRDAAAGLPDRASLDRLRRAGVATVVLLADAAAGTRYEGLDLAALSARPGLQVQQTRDIIVVLLER